MRYDKEIENAFPFQWFPASGELRMLLYVKDESGKASTLKNSILFNMK